MTRHCMLLLLTFIFLAGCNLQQGAGPQAWIDAPLDGSNLPLAPYKIVFHAYAAGNPKAVGLTINGQAVTPDPLELNQPLVTVSYQWSPEQPGRYVIVARTQDQKGTWSEPHTHVVVIGETTITPTFTATPTPTITPTITPTATLPASSVFSNLRLSTTIFYRADQLPRNVSFTVKVNDPAGIQAVEIYFRLRNPNTGDTTSWDNESMVLQGAGIYAYTLDCQHPALTPTSPKTMILEYQFIVTHPDLSMTRSPVYGDVTLQGP